MKLFWNILLTLIAIALGVYLVIILIEPIRTRELNEVKKNEIIKRLEYVRLAQFAYKSIKGSYTDNWDSLINTVKGDSFRIIKSIGDPDDTTVVHETYIIYKHISDSIFPPNFPIDSLKYIPFTKGGIFELQAGKINQRGVDVHVFQVTDTKPFDPDRPLILGSMSEANTSGNWK